MTAALAKETRPTHTPEPATEAPATSPPEQPATEAPPAPTEAPPPPGTPPTPTEIPRRDLWPAPNGGVTISKIGLHAVRNASPRIMQFVRTVHPVVFKAVDDVGWLSDVKRESPGTMTIGRFEAPIEIGGDDPQGAGRDFVDRWLGQYRANPGADYWEGWNEVHPLDDGQWNWYAQWEGARACKMKEYGLRAAIGGFSTGTPEWDQMAKFMPAFETAKACGADFIFTLHEYSAPTVYYGLDIGIPGAPDIPGRRGILLFRYRYWYEGYLKPRGWGNVPLVISEWGIDGSVAAGRPGPAGFGWHDFTDWWSSSGLASDAELYYIDQMKWYDSEVSKDPYVAGFAIYTAGGHTQDQFKSYDIEDVLAPLAQYVATLPLR
ncbi:MAG: hypothetical protein HY023_08130 [Chloroflexi bacterium]|nr:hypothetical protein [Chloroflexota bacterium]